MSAAGGAVILMSLNCETISGLAYRLTDARAQWNVPTSDTRDSSRLLTSSSLIEGIRIGMVIGPSFSVRHIQSGSSSLARQSMIVPDV